LGTKGQHAYLQTTEAAEQNFSTANFFV